MLFGLLPIPIIMYYGVVETVIYKRMAGQVIHNSISNLNVHMLKFLQIHIGNCGPLRRRPECVV